MELLKYVIEYDGEVVINKEYSALVKPDMPLCIEWFKDNRFIVEPEGFQKIKINENLIILRKGEIKKGKTDMLPFIFLERVRRKNYDGARSLLSFPITDQQLQEYFGSFELLVNNYLCEKDVFSILPIGDEKTKNFRFEINEEKIVNIKDC